jgi:hypothetical protein
MSYQGGPLPCRAGAGPVGKPACRRTELLVEKKATKLVHYFRFRRTSVEPDRMKLIKAIGRAARFVEEGLLRQGSGLAGGQWQRRTPHPLAESIAGSADAPDSRSTSLGARRRVRIRGYAVCRLRGERPERHRIFPPAAGGLATYASTVAHAGCRTR